MTHLATARPAVVPAPAEWWRGACIYQIYPLSFADSNNDGIGDLRGVTGKLEYIASLSVDAIWLSPFFTSPMRDFGYDVSDYRGVDPRFGTLADFDALVARAHALGLKVLIDQIYSHTSDEHAWFHESRQGRDSAKSDWYVWADAKPDGAPPSNWQSVFGGASWTWDARRGQYYLHNFLPQQPDLNVHNRDVQDALLDVMRFWLDRGVDGFRLDAVNFAMHDPALTDNPPAPPGGKRTRPFDYQRHLHNQSHPDIPAFLTRLRALANAHGATFLVAEVGGEQAQSEMKLYTAPPERLHSAYGFHYLYASALTPALIAEGMAQWPGEPEVEGWPSWAFSNHDAPRAVSRWRGPVDRKVFAEMALLLLVCLRGNVFLYQGEELGLPQAQVPFEKLRDPEAIANWPQTLGRDGARSPIPWCSNAANAGFSDAEPWLPVDPAHAPLAVDAQEADPGSTLHAARRLIRLRQAHEALRTGKITFHEVGPNMLVFERGEGPGRLLCVFNLGSAATSWRAPPGARVIEQLNMDPSRPDELPPAGALLARLP